MISSFTSRHLPKRNSTLTRRPLSHRQMKDGAFIWKDEADGGGQHPMKDVDRQGCRGSAEGGCSGARGTGSEGKRPKGGGTPIVF